MADVDVLCRTQFESRTAELLARVTGRPILQEAGQRKVDRMVRGLGRSGDSIPGLPPVSRHGARGFAGRFAHEMVNDETLRYGNTSRQARILHQGGEVKPTAGHQYLTIPFAKEAQGKRAVDFKNTFFVRTMGHLFLAQIKWGRKLGEQKNVTFLFLLVRRVLIMQHPYGLLWDQTDNNALYKSIQRRFEGRQTT